MDIIPRKRTKIARLDPDRTLTLVRSPTGAIPDRASANPRTSGQHSLSGYLIAAAVGALLVGFGILLGGLVRGMEPWLQQRSSRASVVDSRPAVSRATHGAADIAIESGSVSNDAPAVSRSSEVASVISARDARPEPSSAGSSGVRSVAKPASVSPRRSARPLVASRAEAVLPTLASIRYCAQSGETVFRPAPLTGVDDSEDLAAQAPRPDSGLMRLLFTVSAPPTLATVSFENGGDTSVFLQRLEESTNGRGFRVVRAALPASVSAGGVKELLRYSVAPGESETYERRYLAVDRRVDSWTASVELVPCPN